MVAVSSNLTSIRTAARALRLGVPKLKRLINEGKLQAFKIGGTDDRPYLRVDLQEAERAIREDARYIPPSLRQQRRHRRPAASAVDPAFQDL